MSSNIVKVQTPSSSNIASVAYDYLMHNLIVEFKNGTTYEYVNVPENEFKSMCEADSVGRYFVSSIKSKYDFLKLI